MGQAIIWLDDEGGVIWLRRHWRWFMGQSFDWESLFDTPLLLPARTEVSIISALSGERLIFDTVPPLKIGDRRAMIKRKLAGHFTDTSFIDGVLQGRVNALHYRLCGIGLPQAIVDSFLTHVQMTQAECKEIIPLASLFSRLVYKRRMGKGLWLIVYRQRMQIYFFDEIGLHLAHNVAMPLDNTALAETIKKTQRALLAQKWIQGSEVLAVHYFAMPDADISADLPTLERVQWYVEQTLSLGQLWQRYRSGLNCAPLPLRRAYQWRRWNRLAWYAAAAVISGLLILSAYTFFAYQDAQQRLQQLAQATAATTKNKKILGKTAQTLLAIHTYQQQHAQVKYEEILMRLSHILVDFPLWHLDNVEWQYQPIHILRLTGRWLTVDEMEQLNARLERALVRQLQAKQVHITVLNQQTGQLQIELHFTAKVEEE